MPKIETKDERNLLLYIETRCVDYGGSLDNRHLNDADRELLDQWKSDGFINYGRIAFKMVHNRDTTNWVTLSEEAWKEAWQQRIARFTRVHGKRSWMTAEEYRNS